MQYNWTIKTINKSSTLPLHHSLFLDIPWTVRLEDMYKSLFRTHYVLIILNCTPTTFNFDKISVANHKYSGTLQLNNGTTDVLLMVAKQRFPTGLVLIFDVDITIRAQIPFVIYQWSASTSYLMTTCRKSRKFQELLNSNNFLSCTKYN